MPRAALTQPYRQWLANAVLCIAVPTAGCATAATPSAESANEASAGSTEGGELRVLGALPAVGSGSSADTPRTHQGLLIARSTLDAAMPAPPADRSYAVLQRWVDTEVVPWVEQRRAQTEEVRGRFALEA